MSEQYNQLIKSINNTIGHYIITSEAADRMNQAMNDYDRLNSIHPINPNGTRCFADIEKQVSDTLKYGSDFNPEQLRQSHQFNLSVKMNQEIENKIKNNEFKVDGEKIFESIKVNFDMIKENFFLTSENKDHSIILDTHKSSIIFCKIEKNDRNNSLLNSINAFSQKSLTYPPSEIKLRRRILNVMTYIGLNITSSDTENEDKAVSAANKLFDAVAAKDTPYVYLNCITTEGMNDFAITNLKNAILDLGAIGKENNCYFTQAIASIMSEKLLGREKSSQTATAKQNDENDNSDRSGR